MSSEIQAKKKFTVALATVNLLLWVWAAVVLARHSASLSPTHFVPGLAVLLALWIQYRAVLDLRRPDKKPA